MPHYNAPITKEKGRKTMQYYLAPEDAQRIKRLSDEVQERLEEIALIAARVADMTLEPNSVRKFVHQRMAPAEAADAPVIDWVEIFDPTPQHPEMCVVHYSDCHGVIEVPCGTPITG